MAKRATSIYDNWYKRNKHELHRLIIILLVMFVSVSVLFAETKVAADNELLKVWFFDIGQGDAIFIQAPTGEQMIIDTGRSNAVLSKLGSVMLPWDRTIDTLLLTHEDADHISGAVPILENYIVENIYENGVVSNTPIAKALQASIINEDTNFEILQKGDVISLGEATLEVLWPTAAGIKEFSSERNNTSIVLKLNYGETSILLTGDMEKEAEEHVGKLVGDVDVLKVGHHGSYSSSSLKFLKDISAEVAVVSVGEDNSYGHPHATVLRRLQAEGMRILRTDLDSDILLVSDGKGYKISPRPLPF